LREPQRNGNIIPAAIATPENGRIAASSFHKRSQLFIGARNETLSVVAMSVNNPDRSPLVIYS
jgi:hypothetical protein